MRAVRDAMLDVAMNRVALLAILCPTLAGADESIDLRGASASLRAPAEPGLAITKRADETALPRHTIYAEVLGKAGPYGVGYELGITRGLALGVAASYAVIRDQQITIAPYVHADLLRGRKHSLFGDFGVVFVHSRIPSPVPEWDGTSDSGAGGQASVGWEWRPWKLLLRTSMGVAVGEGGAGPFLGVAMGARRALVKRGRIAAGNVRSRLTAPCTMGHGRRRRA